MGAGSAIEWTHHTFNPWWGCTLVSEGCRNCYAEAFDNRLGGDHFGPGKARRTFGDKHWAEPLRWNRQARTAGVRERVFCASMADVFDPEVPDAWRDRLFALIADTPELDWLLLTKRPEAARDYLATVADPETRRRLWLGVTAEDQAQADARVPVLLQIDAAVRFVSCEPLLGPVDLTRFMPIDATLGSAAADRSIDWVIAGGESGHGARFMDEGWVRFLRDQCRNATATVWFFYKQRLDGRTKISLPELDGETWSEIPEAWWDGREVAGG